MASTKATTKRKATSRSLKKVSRRDAKKDLIARRNDYAAKFFPYIEKVARRLARRLPAHVEIDDLISSGVIGLMDRSSFDRSSRTDVGRKLALGSIAMVAITCSR